MKTDLSKPHIYIDGIAINEEVAKAAPELLSSLETLERMVSNTVRLLDEKYSDQFIKPLEDAREAIQKATGQLNNKDTPENPG